MATLHIIYDPDDKIDHKAKFVREANLSVAILSLPKFYDSCKELELAAEDLTKKLLKHHYGYAGK